MTTYTCEKCARVFKQKSGYKDHMEKKIDCSQTSIIYEVIRDLNRELKFKSKDEYFQRATEHSKFIPDPKSYFNGIWNCWYDFLGVDCSIFPQTKADWVRVCKEREFIDWEDYKQKRDESLPENPSELYDDFKNYDMEMGVEEEHML